MNSSPPSIDASDVLSAFFDEFNRRRFFEAHEVLEPLWLTTRSTPVAPFYKGLIQIAGAFVHVQKLRPGPAMALLRLARENLAPFSPWHKELDVAGILAHIDRWAAHLTGGPTSQAHLDFPTIELGQPLINQSPGQV